MLSSLVEASIPRISAVTRFERTSSQFQLEIEAEELHTIVLENTAWFAGTWNPSTHRAQHDALHSSTTKDPAFVQPH